MLIITNIGFTDILLTFLQELNKHSKKYIHTNTSYIYTYTQMHLIYKVKLYRKTFKDLMENYSYNETCVIHV